MNVRVVVFGGRDLNPFKVANWLALNAHAKVAEHFNAPRVSFAAIIMGDARGADFGARLWHDRLEPYNPRRLEPFPANWDRYGNAAGPKRNRQMIVEGLPHIGIAFPGNTGTADMKRQMNSFGVPFITVEGEFK